MIGKTLLHYEIKSLIGKGGMGNVYLGEHTSIGRKVAIKALLPELANNPEIRERFKNEASVMARLQHPGIVLLFDYVDNEDGLFLIMELVNGQEITDLLKKLNEPLSIDRAKAIMINVLEAFDYAHENGIVHRDVKPSNILITPGDQVKVLDFGIAKLVGDAQFNLTKTGTQVGTVYYMSPEQVKAKELDRRSDIYSLGVTFYELLAGFCPYKGTTSEYEVCDKIVREPLLPLTNTMGDEYLDVWKVIEKATQKNVDDRFQTCSELIEALKKGMPPSSAKSKPLAKEIASVRMIENPIQPAVMGPSNDNKNWIYFLILGIIVSLVIIFTMTRPQYDNILKELSPSGVYEDSESNGADESEYADSAAIYEEGPGPLYMQNSENDVQVPFYIINTSAVKKEKDAIAASFELSEDGYESGYLWIPDYESLSGAEYFSVYIGPFTTREECAIVLDRYQLTVPKAYGTLVSHTAERDVVSGLDDAQTN